MLRGIGVILRRSGRSVRGSEILFVEESRQWVRGIGVFVWEVLPGGLDLEAWRGNER